LFGVLWAALQIALPLGASYADAKAAVAGAGAARAHAESERSGACQRPHSPDCGVCRFLANHSATPAAPPAGPAPRNLSRDVTPVGPHQAPSVAVALARSRSPPQA
jgi:hypothetical protein